MPLQPHSINVVNKVPHPRQRKKHTTEKPQRREPCNAIHRLPPGGLLTRRADDYRLGVQRQQLGHELGARGVGDSDVAIQAIGNQWEHCRAVFGRVGQPEVDYSDPGFYVLGGAHC